MPKSTTFLRHGTNFYGVFGQLSDYLKKSAKFASVIKLSEYDTERNTVFF